MKIKIFYVNMFLVALGYELLIMPYLALLDHGLSGGFDSNYFARFSYIFLAIIAFCFMLHITRRPLLYFHCLFVLGLVVGMFNGVLKDTINPQFFSHVFYYVMPLVMLTFGYNIASFLANDTASSVRFQNFLIFTIVMTLIFLVLQLVFNYLKLHDYPKFGYNSLFLAFPLLIARSWHLLALPVAFLGNKASFYLPVIFASALSLALMPKKFKNVLVRGYLYLCIVGALGVSVWLYLHVYEYYELLDSLTSGRLTESFSAFKTFDFFGWSAVLGNGFGWTYTPWPNKLDLSGISYANYVSHYVHFGNFSYLMVSGLLFYLAFWVLMGRAVLRSFKILAYCEITALERYFLAVFLSILTISLFGSILASSAHCWFFTGCAHFVIHKYKI